ATWSGDTTSSRASTTGCMPKTGATGVVACRAALGVRRARLEGRGIATTTSTTDVPEGYLGDMKPPTTGPPSDVAILGRVLASGDGPLPPEMALYLLGLGFSAADNVRMHELAEKNQ